MALGVLLGVLAMSMPVALVVAHMTRHHHTPPPQRVHEPDWLDEPELWELLEERRQQRLATDRTTRQVQTMRQREPKYIEVEVDNN